MTREHQPFGAPVTHKHRAGHAAARARDRRLHVAAPPDATPTALLHNLKHNRVLHERGVILLTMQADEVPTRTS